MSNLAVIASQTFSPNKFSGLKLWLKANDKGTIIRTGSLVDQWISKSTVTNKATQTGSSRPTTNSRTINGQNVLDFDGVDDFMALDNQPIVGTEARTIFVVGFADVSGQKILISLSHATVMNGDLYRFTTEIGLRISGSNRIFANDAIDSSAKAAIVVFTNQANSNLTFDTNNFQAYKNGGLITSTGAVSPTITIDTRSSSNAIIGDEGNFGGADRLNGVIGEIIIYDRVIPTSERQETESYLSNDWRIPLV